MWGDSLHPHDVCHQMDWTYHDTTSLILKLRQRAVFKRAPLCGLPRIQENGYCFPVLREHRVVFYFRDVAVPLFTTVCWLLIRECPIFPFRSSYDVIQQCWIRDLMIQIDCSDSAAICRRRQFRVEKRVSESSLMNSTVQQFQWVASEAPSGCARTSSDKALAELETSSAIC